MNLPTEYAKKKILEASMKVSWICGNEMESACIQSGVKGEVVLRISPSWKEEGNKIGILHFSRHLVQAYIIAFMLGLLDGKSIQDYEYETWKTSEFII